VAPTRTPLSGQGMTYTDMRVVSASDETGGLDEADPLAVGLSIPLGWNEEGVSGITAA
jgi:hypothetical protein